MLTVSPVGHHLKFLFAHLHLQKFTNSTDELPIVLFSQLLALPFVNAYSIMETKILGREGTHCLSSSFFI